MGKEFLIENIVKHNLFYVASSLDKEKWILLKNGSRAPLFFDTSKIIAYPKLVQQMAEFAIDLIKDKKIAYDLIMGAPYGGLPLGYCIANILQAPCLALRKEGFKNYSTAGEILGIYKKGDRVLIIEDATVTANTVIEFVSRLRKNGLEVTDVITMIDVGQDGVKNLKTQNVCLHALFTWKDPYVCYKIKNFNLLSPEMREYFDNMFGK